MKISKVKVLEVLENNRVRATTAALVVAGSGTLASAQEVAGGANAVSGLELDNMITAASEGIRTLISNNAGPLFLAALPIMAFFFIWNRVRSLF